MEKTKEQKLASIDRFNSQKEKALKKLSDAKDLYEYIDAVKYAYSLSMRYKSISLLKLVGEDPFGVTPFLSKCLDAGILKPWNNTYWFDKEKAESLQQYLLEHNN